MTTQINRDYPPEKHMLRDLKIDFAFKGETCAEVRVPVVPEICTSEGSVRIGVAATMVDVLGGILSSRVLHPDWMATASLSIHTYEDIYGGAVTGLGKVIRVGRKMSVIQVDVHAQKKMSSQPVAPVGSALMTFSRLRADRKTVIADIHSSPNQTFNFGLENAGLDRDYLAVAGVRIKDAQKGIVAIDMGPYVCNSIGSLQGGMVATLADEAGRLAAECVTGQPMKTRDLVIQYISAGKVGPFETRTRVLRTGSEYFLSRVEIVDTGAGGRLMAVVMNTGAI